MDKMQRSESDANRALAANRPSTEGLSAHVLERIAEFNARPMRRKSDVRVLGWEVIES